MTFLEMKKKAISSIANKIKGFLRNSSGSPPISLESCADTTAIDYKIYGNSIQDGTPSPDNPIEVQNVGELVTDETDVNYGKYKIPVTARSKNLFNEELLLGNIYTTKTDDGYKFTGYPVVYNSSSDLVKYIKSVLKPNVTYTLSRSVSGYVSDSVGFIWIRDSSTNLVQVEGYYNGVSSSKFTLSQEQIDGIVNIYIYGQNRSNPNTIFNYIQLEEGSTATDYEPYRKPVTTNIYLDEPLRKVRDYSDYIDFKNSMVVRNIIECVLEHDCSMYEKLKNVVRFSYNTALYLPPIKNVYEILSTFLKYHRTGWHYDIESIFHHHHTYYNYYISLYWSRLGLTYDGTNVYRMDDETQTALTDSEICAIGHEYLLSMPEEDRKIYMILKTPTETSMSLPILPTFKGITTIYEVGTAIQPYNIEVNYYSNVKGE